MPQKRRTIKDILAAIEGGPEVFFACGDLNLVAAKDDGDKLPSFKMDAYNGGQMTLAGWPYDVVVDLKGMQVGAKSRPILRDHDPKRPVGHSTKINKGISALGVEGVISMVNSEAEEVVTSGRNKFPWQASIGARVTKAAFVPEGKSAKINGKTFDGPIVWAKRSKLGEVSVVALGADDTTSTKIAAMVAGIGESDMKFNEWLKAEYGLNAEDLSAEQTKKFEALFATAEGEAEGEGEGEAEEPAKKVEGTADNVVNEIRAEAARVSEINAVCVKHPEIAAKAIKAGWNSDKAENAVLKVEAAHEDADSKIKKINIIPGAKVDAAALKAGIVMGSGFLSDDQLLKAGFEEKALDLGHKLRRLGIRDTIRACCEMDGKPVPAITADASEWIRAGFSTTNFAGLLSDSANKILLSSYRAVPSAARIIARKLSVNDFKTHTGYRLTGDGIFEKVADGGALKHGELADQSFAHSVDTYGKMLGLTRKDMINDDLGAFTAIPNLLGRGAALKVESLFWALVIANTDTFFGSGNNNYIDGADTVLSATGLDEAVQTLEDQTDPDGNPILVGGKYLVVPTALKGTAQRLYSSELVVGDSDRPDANIYQNAYSPVATPYLTSALEWYLFGDPADVAAFGIAYLNGVDTPVIEEVDPGAEYLGMAWRGYMDVGVTQIDPRGAVKSKGAA